MQNITIPETIKIPSTVKIIGDYAFMSARVKSITIPDGCTVIGVGAFFDNWKMEKIIIPSSVSSIGEDAFSYCDKLTIYTLAGSCAWDYANERDIPVSATGVEAKFNLAYAYVNKATNKLHIVIDGVGIDEGKVFYVTYDENGRYLEDALIGESVSADEVALVRCFMWEDKNSMKPLCEPIDAEITVIGSGGSGGSGGTAAGGTAVPEVGSEDVFAGVETAVEV